MATKRDLEKLDRINNSLREELLANLAKYGAWVGLALDKYRDNLYDYQVKSSKVAHEESIIGDLCASGKIDSADHRLTRKLIKAIHDEKGLGFEIKEIEEKIKVLKTKKDPQSRARMVELYTIKNKKEKVQSLLPAEIIELKEDLINACPEYADTLIKCATQIGTINAEIERVVKTAIKESKTRVLELVKANEELIMSGFNKYRNNPTLYSNKKREAERRYEDLLSTTNSLIVGYESSEKMRFEINERNERRSTKVEVKEVEVEIEEPTK